MVTAEKSRRIAKFAFDYATRHGRKKVTCVHKANIMKLGDGLFLREGGRDKIQVTFVFETSCCDP